MANRKRKYHVLVLNQVDTKLNPSKKVYGYIGGKLVGEWDSLTKCGSALGLTRAIVKKHIESGIAIESGYTLKLN